MTLRRVLLAIWATIITLAITSVFFLNVGWMVNSIFVIGVVATLVAIKQYNKQKNQQQKVLLLSHGSKCVWQMDREA